MSIKAAPDHTAVHRYGINTNDVMTVLFSAGIAGAVMFLYQQGRGLTVQDQFIWASCAAALAGFFVVRVSWKRKNRSMVVATLRGRHLDVESQGTLGHTWVDLNEVETVTVVQFGASDAFVLWAKSRTEIKDRTRNPGCARVPVRLLNDPIMYGIVKEALETTHPTRLPLAAFNLLEAPSN